MTVAHVYMVAFQGIEAREVDVRVHISDFGGGQFNAVGLADKAVAESRERVRAALSAIGLALPFKRITVNLAPADLPKKGSHYDLPITLVLLAAMGVIPASEMANYVAPGELSLDAAATPVAGVRPGRGQICPAANGPEAAFAGGIEIVATPSLIALVFHMKGASVLLPPEPKLTIAPLTAPDLRDVKGRVSAKRALEIAGGGGHYLLIIGPPRRGQVHAGPAPARPVAGARRALGSGDFHDPVAGARFGGNGVRTNAEAEGELLDRIATPDAGGAKLLTEAAERMKLSARGYHRVLKVARTIADLAGADTVSKPHVAEALSYRRLTHLA